MANNIIRRAWNQNRMVNIEDLTGAAFQAESGGHTFEISGIDDTGAAVALSGTVSGVFRRPDNADIALTGSASDGVVSVTLSEDCYAVPGRFGLTIFVTSNSQKVAVYACVGTVAVSSTGNVAGDTPQDVVDLINAISAAVATIPADYTDLMAAIAPTYSNSALYPVGSYAWYNGSLYRCTTAITTAETWTAAHWTVAVIGNDVSDLKSAFDKVTEGGNLFIIEDATEGYRLSSTGENYVDSSSFVSDYIEVSVGLEYSKNSPEINAYHRMAVYNASKVKTRVIDNSNTVVIQSGEKYVRFCGLRTEMGTAVFKWKDLTAIDREAREITSTVGKYYYEEIESIYNTTIGAAKIYDVDFSAGDTIKLDYAVSNPGTGHQLAVVTYVNNTNTDYFLNLTNTSETGSAEITITTDATKLKVYSTSGTNTLNFYKKCSESDLGMDLLNQVVTNKNNNSKNTIDIQYLTDEISYSIIGEASLMNNDEYNPHEFMKIVMLDNNYKFFSVANIKRIIDQMYAVDLNYLELGFGGSGHGLSFKLNDMTFTARGKSYDINNCVITDSGEFLDEDDMKEIISYAKAKGIEIIPSLNVISHMTALLTGRPEYWYNSSASTLDINNPDACDFAIGIAELYGKWFSDHGCHFWNLCADEFYNYAYGYPYLQEHGEYQYATIINKVAFALSKYRYTLLCWNDPICVNSSIVPFINRRMIVNYWAHKEGYGTLSDVLSDGYRVINSSDGIYWICNSSYSVTEEQMRQFDYTKFSGGGICENPAGAKFCIWIGTRESPSLDDGGTNITNDVLPLIEAFGETVNAQLGN